MEEKEKITICHAGITEQERNKLKDLVTLFKTKYNQPKMTFTLVIETLIDNIENFAHYNLKNPVQNGKFSILKIYANDQLNEKINHEMNKKMRDKSNLVRWLINVAHEIEFNK